MRAPGARLTVSVNVSTRQVAHGDLVGTVAQVLATTGIDPDRLALEITESVLMEEGDAALATLRGLKSLGVGLFLDDFGTGYSSLSYLKRFPIDALKIDRSFVSELGKDIEDSIIVAAVMSMARALGLTVVAEGVETPQQFRHLQTLECLRAQGYFFAKPMAPETLTGLIDRADGGPLRLLPEAGEPVLDGG
jgi:EAL domain-containing protein (putative c-di-GMP-specific phosphodiesterase class I)